MSAPLFVFAIIASGLLATHTFREYVPPWYRHGANIGFAVAAAITIVAMLAGASP